MSVPDYQSVMLPLLKLAEERKAEISTDDAVEALATRLDLTDDASSRCFQAVSNARL